MRAALDDSLSAAAHKSASRRIASLDWARGIMLVASVLSNSLIAPPKWFDHARWSGIHPIDIIFPMFVTLSGCGLAFAMHRRVKPGPLARRFAVLMLVGLAYNAVMAWSLDVATWRVTGVLQLYAVLQLTTGGVDHPLPGRIFRQGVLGRGDQSAGRIDVTPLGECLGHRAVILGGLGLVLGLFG